ncbi:hypothetical protein YA29_16550 [Klebsiella aerogenes]|uniref:hypothetical protein n=1 Tax=Klebsiella aerogenes TaxID=548 RepID=UPI00063C589C|nr:hypothetical protein [Klebsiella aerogenes]KLF28692.1 hypothetical protein YA29_16550 [Klebsiella aerogenes]
MPETQLRGYWKYCGLNIFMLSRLWKERLESRLRAYNITLQELMTLRLIANDVPVTREDLKTYIGEYELPLKMLEGKSLCQSKSDDEGANISPTQAGLELVQQTENILKTQEEFFMGHLPRATRKGVNLTLESALDKSLT